MYTRQKLYREETHNKSRKTQKNMPSFSSTLLDEIYRSTEKTEDPKVKRYGCSRAAKTGNSKTGLEKEEEEEIASFRACLVEKWMEKEANEKKALSKNRAETESANKSLHDNDLLFFSSTSSSNSDSSGTLSSSDTEFFGGATTTTTTKRPNGDKRVSCFSTRPKPVKTGGASYLFDEFPQRKKTEEDDDLIKSKSRALKIYANLKKVKQPISPGGRLTSFINSLFSNANGNSNKNTRNNNKGSSSTTTTTATTCSSASSFSRSCLSKYSPKSREKMRSTSTTQRTVRFHPVSVIVDADSRPCGQKTIYDPLAELKLSKVEKKSKVEEAAEIVGYCSKRVDDFSVFRKIDDEDEDEDDDRMSDSSSDLFELDHLALFGDNRFCEELPVYETTRLDTNCAMASRLIR